MLLTVRMYEKNSDTNLNKNSNLSSLYPYSNNTWINKWVFTKASGSTDAISGFNYYKYTVTGAAKNVTNEKGSCKNINKQGISYIKYKAFDNAGNSSKDSANKTIKLDRKAPKCSESRAVSDGVDVSGCSATKKVTTTGSTGERKEAELANYTVKQEGESTTQWFVYDNAGNRGDCNKITERVDKTPPTMIWSHVAGTHDNNDGITVTVTCTDENDGSGIKDSGTSKKIASPSTNVTFSYICTDRVGNPTPGSRIFSVRKYSADSSCGQYDCNPHSCLYDCTIMMYAFCNDPKYKKFKEAEGASVYSACTTVDKADDRTKTGKYCYKTCYDKCNNTCWHF